MADTIDYKKMTKEQRDAVIAMWLKDGKLEGKKLERFTLMLRKFYTATDSFEEKEYLMGLVKDMEAKQ